MERISTEVPIVDVETPDKEITQDVNEDYLQGKVRFKPQPLYYKNMHCVFPMYRSKGKTACMTTP